MEKIDKIFNFNIINDILDENNNPVSKCETVAQVQIDKEGNIKVYDDMKNSNVIKMPEIDIIMSEYQRELGIRCYQAMLKWKRGLSLDKYNKYEKEFMVTHLFDKAKREKFAGEDERLIELSNLVEENFEDPDEFEEMLKVLDKDYGEDGMFPIDDEDEELATVSLELSLDLAKLLLRHGCTDEQIGRIANIKGKKLIDLKKTMFS